MARERGLMVLACYDKTRRGTFSIILNAEKWNETVKHAICTKDSMGMQIFNHVNQCQKYQDNADVLQ